MKKILIPGAIMIFVMQLAGCEGKVITEADINDNGGGGNAPLTFTEIQNQIFTPFCATSGCHVGTTPQSGLNLGAGFAYAAIVDVNSTESPGLKLIEPGDSNNSYLIRKVLGTGSGSRMPSGRPPLSASVIAALADWVDRGAEQ